MQELAEIAKSVHLPWWYFGILALLFVAKPFIDALALRLKVRDVIRLAKEVPPDIVKAALPLMFATRSERKALSRSRSKIDEVN